jgi:hypothetical protein
MTDKELFKLALDALEANYLLVNGTETHGGLEQCLDGYYSSCFDTDPINKQTEEAITALKERLAQPEQEPLAWPCLIDSADFSANTITLVMQCEGYKVSAGTHWLSTTPKKNT